MADFQTIETNLRTDAYSYFISLGYFEWLRFSCFVATALGIFHLKKKKKRNLFQTLKKCFYVQKKKKGTPRNITVVYRNTDLTCMSVSAKR